MVMHTLAAMLAVERMHRVLLVVSAADGFWQGRATDARLGIAACGGATRAETVSNGLQELLRMGASGEDWVLVHDAARCLVASAQVNALIDACLPDAVGGLLALKLPDTLKQQAAGAGPARVAQTVERSDKWLAQTPQMFRIAALLAALQAAGAAVTDEASAMEPGRSLTQVGAGWCAEFQGDLSRRLRAGRGRAAAAQDAWLDGFAID